ncbi:MAG: class I SAM-dependent methyltransferase [Candidatus Omnitrophica bacterium]|nr:class I SAM-dependent methyltransferase [Candidatus Omnitrophota bacterium]
MNKMLNRETIYRDSKRYYIDIGAKKGYSSSHILFCKQHAGKRVLDFGCATGNCCLELKKLGFDCVGVDINEEYVKITQERGIEAHVVKGVLPFAERSFDTVLMFELLEHLRDPDTALSQAKKVAKKNILLTVPNITEFDRLKRSNLTYEHMLELDHVNFFTKESLTLLLSKHFDKFYVRQEKPIFVHKLLPWYIRKPLSLCYKLKIIKPAAYYSLYAECLV